MNSIHAYRSFGYRNPSHQHSQDEKQPRPISTLPIPTPCAPSRVFPHTYNARRYPSESAPPVIGCLKQHGVDKTLVSASEDSTPFWFNIYPHKHNDNMSAHQCKAMKEYKKDAEVQPPQSFKSDSENINVSTNSSVSYSCICQNSPQEASIANTNHRSSDIRLDLSSWSHFIEDPSLPTKRIQTTVLFPRNRIEKLGELDVADRCRVGQYLRQDVIDHFQEVCPIQPHDIFISFEFSRDMTLCAIFDPPIYASRTAIEQLHEKSKDPIHPHHMKSILDILVKINFLLRNSESPEVFSDDLYKKSKHTKDTRISGRDGGVQSPRYATKRNETPGFHCDGSEDTWKASSPRFQPELPSTESIEHGEYGKVSFEGAKRASSWWWQKEFFISRKIEVLDPIAQFDTKGLRQVLQICRADILSLFSDLVSEGVSIPFDAIRIDPSNLPFTLKICIRFQVEQTHLVDEIQNRLNNQLTISSKVREFLSMSLPLEIEQAANGVS